MSAQQFGSRPAPTARGFKPDLLGFAVLLVILAVGHLVTLVMLWDLRIWIVLDPVASYIGVSTMGMLMSLTTGLTRAVTFAVGFALCIAAFGVPGRKLASLPPLLLLLSPILFTFLEVPFATAVGLTTFSPTIFWLLTYGIIYGIALAAWAYGFGRSVAGVVTAGLLGIVALTAYRFFLSGVFSDHLDMFSYNSFAVEKVLVDLGFDVVMVAVLALSCVIGPGLARAPIAPAPRFAGPPSMPYRDAQPRGAQPHLGHMPPHQTPPHQTPSGQEPPYRNGVGPDGAGGTDTSPH